MTARTRSSSPFVTEESQAFGSGWISGTAGAVLGLAGFGAALCPLFPTWLTTEFVGAVAPSQLRLLVVAVLVLAASLGVLSLALRRKKTLGVVALGSTLAGGATLLLPAPATTGGPTALAVDVLVLNLLLYSAVYVPIERAWPRLSTTGTTPRPSTT